MTRSQMAYGEFKRRKQQSMWFGADHLDVHPLRVLSVSLNCSNDPLLSNVITGMQNAAYLIENRLLRCPKLQITQGTSSWEPAEL